MRAFVIVGAVASTVALAACGSGTPDHHAPVHHISAAAACKDFQSWYLSLAGNIKTMTNISTLTKAVSEAPSGQLYQDLSTLESNVKTAAATGGSLGAAEKNYLQSNAYGVEQDCQSVNPSS